MVGNVRLIAVTKPKRINMFIIFRVVVHSSTVRIVPHNILYCRPVCKLLPAARGREGMKSR